MLAQSIFDDQIRKCHALIDFAVLVFLTLVQLIKLNLYSFASILFLFSLVAMIFIIAAALLPSKTYLHPQQ